MDQGAWDARYGAEDLVWSSGPNQFLVAETSGMVPGRALDVACGEGRNAIWLAERGWTVTGVDFSSVGLAKAARLASGRGAAIDWVEADVTEWVAPPASFDLVLLFYLQLAPEPRRRALGHAGAAVAPGGTLLLVGHDADNLARGCGGPQDSSVLYRAGEVADLLGVAGMAVERADQVEREVATADGPRRAIDVLVRAVAPAGEPST